MNKASTLADLGKLVASGKVALGTIKRGDPLPEAPPVRERSTNDIFDHMIANLTRQTVADVVMVQGAAPILVDALNDAYDLGKRHGAAEEQLRASTVQQIGTMRAENLLPACVAAVMEQNGMTSMTLDMATVASVFKRCDIKFVMLDDDKTIQYTLTHKIDGAKQ